MDRVKELTESLMDAGCSMEETQEIVGMYLTDDFRGVEKLISICRRRQLDRMHDSQMCIDRLDYMSYRLLEAQKKKENGGERNAL